MKGLLVLILLLPFAVKGQPASKFSGDKIGQCSSFLISEFANKDSILLYLSAPILHDSVKTLYVKRMPYFDKVPDSIGHIAVKVIEFDSTSNMQELYKEQKQKHAAFLYLSDPELKFSHYTIWVMPLQLIKMRKKIHVDFKKDYCKAVFFFNDADGKFIYDHMDCH